jgi:integrase
MVWKGITYVNIDGEVKEKTCTDVRQAVAKRKLDDLIQKWHGPTNPSEQTLAKYLDWWVDGQWQFVDKGRRDEETIKDYVNSFRHVKGRLGHIKLIDLTAADLYNLLVHLANEGRTHYRGGEVVGRGPLAHRTVLRVRAHMEKALATATSLGKIPVNIAKLVEIPATVTTVPKKALSEEQAKLVIRTVQEAAEARSEDLLVYAFLLVGFVNGLRPGENRGLQWHRLDWDYYTDKRGRIYGSIDIDGTLKRKRGYTRNGVRVPERFVMGGVKLDIAASNRIMLLPPEVVEVLRRWRVEQDRQQLAAGPAWNNEHDLIFTPK